MTSRQEEVTRILETDPRSPEALLPLVYDELRELARARLAREPRGQTLEATALVHEAYLRLLGDGSHDWNSKGHFFGASAEAIRRILVERARARATAKRGGDWQRITLSGIGDDGTAEADERILALDGAIAHMEASDSLRAQIVKLRFFTGLTHEQTAEALGVSPATVRRHWTIARARLAYHVKTSAAELDD